jgi:hypothetical protein
MTQAKGSAATEPQVPGAKGINPLPNQVEITLANRFFKCTPFADYARLSEPYTSRAKISDGAGPGKGN